MVVIMMMVMMTTMMMMMMMLTINHKILKYVLYIQCKDEESVVKQAFFDLI